MDPTKILGNHATKSTTHFKMHFQSAVGPSHSIEPSILRHDLVVEIYKGVVATFSIKTNQDNRESSFNKTDSAQHIDVPPSPRDITDPNNAVNMNQTTNIQPTTIIPTHSPGSVLEKGSGGVDSRIDPIKYTLLK